MVQKKDKLMMVEDVYPELRLYSNRVGLFNTHFQNFKQFGIPKAQLLIADVPYNIGKDAYGSNPMWYVNGDNKNGESDLAGKEFFDTDKDFRPAEFMHFCSQMLRPEPKEKGKAPAMVLFCNYDQQFMYIELAKRYGLENYIPLVFRKNYSPQVLKANMRIVGNCEYGLVFYRHYLPKFNNHGRMVYNCIDYPRELGMRRTHSTQKPISLLKRFIDLFTDVDDVVIDPTAGSGSTIVAAASMGRKAYGFEIKKDFYRLACENIKRYIEPDMFDVPANVRHQQKMQQIKQTQLFE